jgi:PLD-like domain
MAEFLCDSQVTTAIEELIKNANEYLYLISPYIKLHERVKTVLQAKKKNPDIEIVIVFGKNEDDTSKSLNKEDFDFLKEFPNITIGYEKRLHAKYYASEDFSIITSMNLHQFSQNNNIEVAVKFRPKSMLSISGDNVDKECFDYFKNVIENCAVIFQSEPVYKSGLLGLTSIYTHSEITTDDSETFFKKKENFEGKKIYKKPAIHEPSVNNGFCIRTGVPIPFNPQRPMSKEAFALWNKFKNMDYPEKFCHKTGIASNGKTSMRKPVL